VHASYSLNIFLQDQTAENAEMEIARLENVKTDKLRENWIGLSRIGLD